MLNKIGIISQEESDAILAGLKEILGTSKADRFTLSVEDENVHTKVENILVEQIGDTGKELHTARSRNDQILVDTRLYTKYQLLQTALNILEFCQTSTCLCPKI